MRIFFAVIGVLAWLWAFLLLYLFSETGGEGKFIAAGIYAIVAMVALGVERILKTLEQIRDGYSERKFESRNEIEHRNTTSYDRPAPA